MWYFNHIIIKLVDAILFPFKSLHPLLTLTILSIAVGIVFILIFRSTSDQNKIREKKEQIQGYMMEMRLFKDNPRILLSAFGNIICNNLSYIKYALKPLLVMSIPVIIILIHLDAWYGYMPLKKGDSVILSVKTRGIIKSHDKVEIIVSDGIVVETPPIWIPDANEVDWRIRVDEWGEHVLKLNIQGRIYEKNIMVSEKLNRVSRIKASSGLWNNIFNLGERPIPENDGIQEIAVHYPLRMYEIFGWKMHWMVIFFILTIISGFTLKGYFNVSI